MEKLSPATQRLLWVILAIVCVLVSALPVFKAVAETLRYLASLIIGGVTVSKPGDAPAPLVDIVQKVAASLGPPPPPIPPADSP